MRNTHPHRHLLIRSPRGPGTRGLVRLRRGCFVEREAWEKLSVEDQHVARAVDVHRSLRGGGAVISHASAAALWGLPTWGSTLARVHVTRAGTSGGRIEQTRHLHIDALDPLDITCRHGIEVTTPARTVLDVARTSGIEAGIVTGDAAIHQGLATTAQMRECLGRLPRRQGIQHARETVGLIDGRSESVGESRSRLVLKAEGLPPPVLQPLLFDEGGAMIGRADFLLEERVVGEFDGRIKYGALLRAGDHPGDVVFREKLREDAIRDAGWTVVRWTWADLADPARLGERVRRSIERARRLPAPRGTWRPS
ncbi:hypothetical protein [Lolliginicoccus levis]|uniref:hypothetical protein n=1 Tax=Lolliginicoccus levis TaxID=2919542 RepID=UPI00241E756D|nr:hypothetical protein [Lolliginicoccus levis]